MNVMVRVISSGAVWVGLSLRMVVIVVASAMSVAVVVAARWMCFWVGFV